MEAEIVFILRSANRVSKDAARLAAGEFKDVCVGHMRLLL